MSKLSKEAVARPAACCSPIKPLATEAVSSSQSSFVPWSPSNTTRPCPVSISTRYGAPACLSPPSSTSSALLPSSSSGSALRVLLLVPGTLLDYIGVPEIYKTLPLMCKALRFEIFFSDSSPSYWETLLRRQGILKCLLFRRDAATILTERRSKGVVRIAKLPNALVLSRSTNAWKKPPGLPPVLSIHTGRDGIVKEKRNCKHECTRGNDMFRPSRLKNPCECMGFSARVHSLPCTPTESRSCAPTHTRNSSAFISPSSSCYWACSTDAGRRSATSVGVMAPQRLHDSAELYAVGVSAGSKLVASDSNAKHRSLQGAPCKAQIVNSLPYSSLSSIIPTMASTNGPRTEAVSSARSSTYNFATSSHPLSLASSATTMVERLPSASLDGFLCSSCSSTSCFLLHLRSPSSSTAPYCQIGQLPPAYASVTVRTVHLAGANADVDDGLPASTLREIALLQRFNLAEDNLSLYSTEKQSAAHRVVVNEDGTRRKTSNCSGNLAKNHCGTHINRLLGFELEDGKFHMVTEYAEKDLRTFWDDLSTGGLLLSREALFSLTSDPYQWAAESPDGLPFFAAAPIASTRPPKGECCGVNGARVKTANCNANMGTVGEWEAEATPHTLPAPAKENMSTAARDAAECFGQDHVSATSFHSWCLSWFKRELHRELVWRVLQQVLHGLLFLHAQGVAHRNLKPENLLINWTRDITTYWNRFQQELAGFEVFSCTREQVAPCPNPDQGESISPNIISNSGTSHAHNPKNALAYNSTRPLVRKTAIRCEEVKRAEIVLSGSLQPASSLGDILRTRKQANNPLTRQAEATRIVFEGKTTADEFAVRLQETDDFIEDIATCFTLKISDLGSGRLFEESRGPYTPENPKDRERSYRESKRLYYRAPEVLLLRTDSGAVDFPRFSSFTASFSPSSSAPLRSSYSVSVDIWSVGVLFMELALLTPPFKADSELLYLLHVFELLGTPTAATDWIEICNLSPGAINPKRAQRRVRRRHGAPHPYARRVSLVIPSQESLLRAQEETRSPFYKDIVRGVASSDTPAGANSPERARSPSASHTTFGILSAFRDTQEPLPALPHNNDVPLPTSKNLWKAGYSHNGVAATRRIATALDSSPRERTTFQTTARRQNCVRPMWNSPIGSFWEKQDEGEGRVSGHLRETDGDWITPSTALCSQASGFTERHDGENHGVTSLMHSLKVKEPICPGHIPMHYNGGAHTKKKMVRSPAHSCIKEGSDLTLPEYDSSTRHCYLPRTDSKGIMREIVIGGQERGRCACSTLLSGSGLNTALSPSSFCIPLQGSSGASSRGTSPDSSALSTPSSICSNGHVGNRMLAGTETDVSTQSLDGISQWVEQLPLWPPPQWDTIKAQLRHEEELEELEKRRVFTNLEVGIRRGDKEDRVRVIAHSRKNYRRASGEVNQQSVVDHTSQTQIKLREKAEFCIFEGTETGGEKGLFGSHDAGDKRTTEAEVEGKQGEAGDLYIEGEHMYSQYVDTRQTSRIGRWDLAEDSSRKHTLGPNANSSDINQEGKTSSRIKKWRPSPPVVRRRAADDVTSGAAATTAASAVEGGSTLLPVAPLNAAQDAGRMAAGEKYFSGTHEPPEAGGAQIAASGNESTAGEQAACATARAKTTHIGRAGAFCLNSEANGFTGPQLTTLVFSDGITDIQEHSGTGYSGESMSGLSAPTAKVFTAASRELEEATRQATSIPNNHESVTRKQKGGPFSLRCPRLPEASQHAQLFTGITTVKAKGHSSHVHPQGVVKNGTVKVKDTCKPVPAEEKKLFGRENLLLQFGRVMGLEGLKLLELMLILSGSRRITAGAAFYRVTNIIKQRRGVRMKNIFQSRRFCAAYANGAGTTSLARNSNVFDPTNNRVASRRMPDNGSLDDAGQNFTTASFTSGAAPSTPRARSTVAEPTTPGQGPPEGVREKYSLPSAACSRDMLQQDVSSARIPARPLANSAAPSAPSNSQAAVADASCQKTGMLAEGSYLTQETATRHVAALKSTQAHVPDVSVHETRKPAVTPHSASPRTLLGECLAPAVSGINKPDKRASTASHQRAPQERPPSIPFLPILLRLYSLSAPEKGLTVQHCMQQSAAALAAAVQRSVTRTLVSGRLCRATLKELEVGTLRATAAVVHQEMYVVDGGPALLSSFHQQRRLSKNNHTEREGWHFSGSHSMLSCASRRDTLVHCEHACNCCCCPTSATLHLEQQEECISAQFFAALEEARQVAVDLFFWLQQEFRLKPSTVHLAANLFHRCFCHMLLPVLTNGSQGTHVALLYLGREPRNERSQTTNCKAYASRYCSSGITASLSCSSSCHICQASSLGTGGSSFCGCCCCCPAWKGYCGYHERTVAAAGDESTAAANISRFGFGTNSRPQHDSEQGQPRLPIRQAGSSPATDEHSSVHVAVESGVREDDMIRNRHTVCCPSLSSAPAKFVADAWTAGENIHRQQNAYVTPENATEKPLLARTAQAGTVNEKDHSGKCVSRGVDIATYASAGGREGPEERTLCSSETTDPSAAEFPALAARYNSYNEQHNSLSLTKASWTCNSGAPGGTEKSCSALQIPQGGATCTQKAVVLLPCTWVREAILTSVACMKIADVYNERSLEYYKTTNAQDYAANVAEYTATKTYMRASHCSWCTRDSGSDGCCYCVEVCPGSCAGEESCVYSRHGDNGLARRFERVHTHGRTTPTCVPCGCSCCGKRFQQNTSSQRTGKGSCLNGTHQNHNKGITQNARQQSCAGECERTSTPPGVSSFSGRQDPDCRNNKPERGGENTNCPCANIIDLRVDESVGSTSAQPDPGGLLRGMEMNEASEPPPQHADRYSGLTLGTMLARMDSEDQGHKVSSGDLTEQTSAPTIRSRDTPVLQWICNNHPFPSNAQTAGAAASRGARGAIEQVSVADPTTTTTTRRGLATTEKNACAWTQTWSAEEIVKQEKKIYNVLEGRVTVATPAWCLSLLWEVVESQLLLLRQQEVQRKLLRQQRRRRVKKRKHNSLSTLVETSEKRTRHAGRYRLRRPGVEEGTQQLRQFPLHHIAEADQVISASRLNAQCSTQQQQQQIYRSARSSTGQLDEDYSLLQSAYSLDNLRQPEERDRELCVLQADERERELHDGEDMKSLYYALKSEAPTVSPTSVDPPSAGSGFATLSQMSNLNRRESQSEAVDKDEPHAEKKSAFTAERAGQNDLFPPVCFRQSSSDTANGRPPRVADRCSESRRQLVVKDALPALKARREHEGAEDMHCASSSLVFYSNTPTASPAVAASAMITSNASRLVTKRPRCAMAAVCTVAGNEYAGDTARQATKVPEQREGAEGRQQQSTNEEVKAHRYWKAVSCHGTEDATSTPFCTTDAVALMDWSEKIAERGMYYRISADTSDYFRCHAAPPDNVALPRATKGDTLAEDLMIGPFHGLTQARVPLVGSHHVYPHLSHQLTASSSSPSGFIESRPTQTSSTSVADTPSPASFLCSFASFPDSASSVTSQQIFSHFSQRLSPSVCSPFLSSVANGLGSFSPFCVADTQKSYSFPPRQVHNAISAWPCPAASTGHTFTTSLRPPSSPAFSFSTFHRSLSACDASGSPSFVSRASALRCENLEEKSEEDCLNNVTASRSASPAIPPASMLAICRRYSHVLLDLSLYQVSLFQFSPLLVAQVLLLQSLYTVFPHLFYMECGAAEIVGNAHTNAHDNVPASVGCGAIYTAADTTPALPVSFTGEPAATTLNSTASSLGHAFRSAFSDSSTSPLASAGDTPARPTYVPSEPVLTQDVSTSHDLHDFQQKIPDCIISSLRQSLTVVPFPSSLSAGARHVKTVSGPAEKGTRAMDMLDQDHLEENNHFKWKQRQEATAKARLSATYCSPEELQAKQPSPGDGSKLLRYKSDNRLPIRKVLGPLLLLYRLPALLHAHPQQAYQRAFQENDIHVEVHTHAYTHTRTAPLRNAGEEARHRVPQSAKHEQPLYGPPHCQPATVDPSESAFSGLNMKGKDIDEGEKGRLRVYQVLQCAAAAAALASVVRAQQDLRCSPLLACCGSHASIGPDGRVNQDEASVTTHADEGRGTTEIEEGVLVRRAPPRTLQFLRFIEQKKNQVLAEVLGRQQPKRPSPSLPFLQSGKRWLHSNEQVHHHKQQQERSQEVPLEEHKKQRRRLCHWREKAEQDVSVAFSRHVSGKPDRRIHFDSINQQKELHQLEFLGGASLPIKLTNECECQRICPPHEKEEGTKKQPLTTLSSKTTKPSEGTEPCNRGDDNRFVTASEQSTIHDLSTTASVHLSFSRGGQSGATDQIIAGRGSHQKDDRAAAFHWFDTSTSVPGFSADGSQARLKSSRALSTNAAALFEDQEVSRSRSSASGKESICMQPEIHVPTSKCNSIECFNVDIVAPAESTTSQLPPSDKLCESSFHAGDHKTAAQKDYPLQGGVKGTSPAEREPLSALCDVGANLKSRQSHRRRASSSTQRINESSPSQCCETSSNCGYMHDDRRDGFAFPFEALELLIEENEADRQFLHNLLRAGFGSVKNTVQ